MSKPFFEIQNAKVWRGNCVALNDLTLSLHHGESVAILGANGAGKSTLLKLMTGELRAEACPESHCLLFGEDRWCLEEIRHRIGIVMPEEVGRFHPEEPSRDVVLSAFRGAYGRTSDMRFQTSEKKLAAQAMDVLGILELGKRFFGQLSSGEKRRFLIARALVHQPEVVVLDEPTTALDFAAKIKLLSAMRGIAKSHASLVLVTHDPSEIPPEISRVILLKDGKLFADAPKRKALRSEILSELFDLKLKVFWANGWLTVRPAHI